MARAPGATGVVADSAAIAQVQDLEVITGSVTMFEHLHAARASQRFEEAPNAQALGALKLKRERRRVAHESRTNIKVQSEVTF